MIKVENDVLSLKNEKRGAKFYNFIKSNSFINLIFFEEKIKELNSKNKHFFDEFIHGLELKSYTFNKYKTKKEKKIFELDIIIKSKSFEFKKSKRYQSLLEGINYTKDLVSEPGNVLHPDEYSKRLLQLKKIGLKVNVFDKKKLKELGMNALLGVGQGSIRGSYLVTLEWEGTTSKKKPLAFVGKGVCFDTGGISLKPAKFM